ncbi:MAG: M23 family metallopeptidase [Candidatus Eisenbacteria bacterium]|nr:M23 family metallopeptidase [Candidatus Eisenbacteria bacterium]
MNIRNSLLFSMTLFLVCTPLAVYSAEPDSAGSGFRFPLQHVGALTSTFSEYRSGHFHAGIDLSTDGEIGMPVAAARAGYVYRVRVSGGGYGKAVELLLDNGMLALYAHLDRFSGEIESFVHSKQLERGSYEIDVFPPPFQIPVVPGETIGYSGNTGFSFGPHLHFELRRGDVAFNPLLDVFPLEEHVSPTFKFVKLTPLESESEIDGKSDPRVFSLKRSREGETYGTPVVPELAGAFLVSVSVFDRTEKANNRLSVYELKLFLDDSVLFESKFDEIESSRSHEVELVYDYGLAKRGEVYTFNLCRFEGSKLRLLERLKPGAGVVDTGLLGLSGSHTLRIQAGDARGNVSTALLSFVANRRPFISSVALRKRESSLLVEAEVQDPENDVRSVRMDYLMGTLNGTFSTVSLEREEQVGRPRAPIRFSTELQLPSSPGLENLGEVEGIFRVWAKDGEGRISRPFTRTLLGHYVPKDVSVHLDVERSKEWAKILARVSPNFLRPRIGVVSGDTLWLQVSEESEGLYTANYKYQPILSDAATAICFVEGENSAAVAASKPLAVRTVRKGWEGDFWSSDLGVGLVYKPQTFYQDTYVSMERKDRESLARGLRFASDIFSIAPVDVVFDKAGTVVIRCDSDVPAADRVGVYRRTSGRNWSYVGAVVDSVNGTVGANVRAFSEFALIKDEAPPSISLVHPRRGRVSRSATPPTYAVVGDVGSGLEWQGMEVSIDGKRVLSEWDPRVSRLSVVYDEPLTEGEHTVAFEVKDRAGNMSLTQTHFRVAR